MSCPLTIGRWEVRRRREVTAANLGIPNWTAIDLIRCGGAKTGEFFVSAVGGMKIAHYLSLVNLGLVL